MKAMIMSRPVSPRKLCKPAIQKLRKNAESEEMDAMEMLFDKLAHMIPSIPKEQKLTKLQILQHVIEYIQDLESQVEFHPEAENLCTGLNYLRISLEQKSYDI
ncbi:protein extra-macrochaetae-like [Paramacrobiotus metropolitanus]|uniref:protein extra-macrochaetae-like n=1 Tax=Paramacrobiotus metropolitanus TaxID=2943436 RepID=UPI002445E1EE|nr:protein extra-macrochaetae-like [Paramacrobiotus metropolitanus]